MTASITTGVKFRGIKPQIGAEFLLSQEELLGKKPIA